MAENLERVKKQAGDKQQAQDQSTTSKALEDLHISHFDYTSPEQPVHLPDEIILQILEYIRHFDGSQKTLASCCLLSRQWYTASVPLLYRRPYLYGKNFDPFLRTMCPSINLHVRKSPLSELVRILDMGSLVHQGSRSLTARLLGRTKNNLEEFVAPQASFAVNCFPALAHSHKLRILDLSLVSESPPLPMLLRAVHHLEQLRVFRLPRSSGFGVHHKPDAFVWPPNIEDLRLSGGIDAHFLHGVVSFPQTLRSLTIEHCPQAKGFAISHLLRNAIRGKVPLRSLKLAHMPRLGGQALDNVLLVLPELERLSVSVDYVSPALFDESDLVHQIWKEEDSDPQPLVHSLRTLELTNSGNPGIEDKISPIDIIIAIDEGSLPKLRQVRVAKSLLWHSSSTAQDADALADVLQEGSRADWERKEWIYADMSDTDYAQADWKQAAGVWAFDG